MRYSSLSSPGKSAKRVLKPPGDPVRCGASAQALLSLKIRDQPLSRVMTRLIGTSSRHRKAQRLAAAAHVDRDKAVRAEATGCAIALLADLELALARAKLLGPA